MNLPAITGAAYVYANFGRWVAECECGAGMMFGAPGYPPVLASSWVCPECGDVNEAVWPDPEMMFGVERLLLLRRYHKNQNWRPGETLEDLQAENAVHGVYDFLKTSELTATPGRTLMTIRDGKLVADLLPQLNPRRELKVITK